MIFLSSNENDFNTIGISCINLTQAMECYIVDDTGKFFMISNDIKKLTKIYFTSNTNRIRIDIKSKIDVFN